MEDRPSSGRPSAFVQRVSRRARLWRHAKVLVVGDPWRLVLLLAVLPLVVGSIITYLSRDAGGLWLEIGTGLIGGSVIGLVFALVQHTLDTNSAQRQAAEGLRFTVSSTTDLNGIDLRSSDLKGSYMRAKVLSTARLDGAVMDHVDLRRAQLDGASLVGASLQGSDLSEANLSNSNLHHAGLAGAVFGGAHLGGARLVDADLTGADLRGVCRAAYDDSPGREGSDLEDSDVESSAASGPPVLSRARLDNADVSDTDFEGVIASFVTARGLDARSTRLEGADLSGADLRGASLSKARCAGADLTGADLRGAVLAGVDLTGARLVGVRLEGADLQGAIIDGADLSRARYVGAHHLERLGLRPVDPPDQVTRHASSAGPSRAGLIDVISIVDTTRGVVATHEVVVGLRRRRSHLDALRNDDLAVSRMDLAPDWGRPDEYGLPTRVTSSASSLRRPSGTVEFEVDGDDLVITATNRSGRATTSVPANSETATIVAAVQLVLCTPGSFRTLAAISAMGELLDQAAPTPAEQRTAVATACAAEDDNPLLLCLRSWLAESSDVAEMQQAVDDTLVAWSRTDDPIRRALLAARLAWAQCQVLHRADPSDSVRLLERARAAGDVALDLLLSGLDPNGRPTTREMSLLALATHAKSFSEHVTEERDDLERGVERYRTMIADLERAGLDVSPTSRNNLGYCAMALAGRVTRGPASDLYDEAATQFDLILSSFGLLDTRATAGSDDRLAPLRRLAELGPDSQEPRDQRLLARPVRLALANRGNLFRLHKQYDAALVCYGAALHLEPKYLEAWAERAWVHAERPRVAGGSDPYDDADADVERMLHAEAGNDSQRAKALRSVCWAFAHGGDPAHCERWFDELQRLDPGCRDLVDLRELVSRSSTPGQGVDEERKVGDVRT